MVHLVREKVEDAFEIERAGDVELQSPRTLRSWLSDDVDAILYLAGAGSELSETSPALSRAVHVDGLAEILDWATGHRSVRIVYASSSAVCGSTPTQYGMDKEAAENVLLQSGLATVGLRFPTVLPRPARSSALTGFLNDALEALMQGRAFSWPIPLDQPVELMSASRAATHLVRGLEIELTRPLVLDLPSTITTPRMLCDAAHAGRSARRVSIIPEIGNGLLTRMPSATCTAYSEFGFPQAETPAELIHNLARLG